MSKSGYEVLEFFIKKDILKKEYSRETPIKKTNPKQKLKKELRRYKIQHKVRFCKPFYRFWFRYIYPSLELLRANEQMKVLETILLDLDNFVSLTFEELSNELLLECFPDVLSSGSYWDRLVELDILLYLPNGKKIVGECKWKNSKICKKTLTHLQNKCQKIDLEIEKYVLFSKSGFSNELLTKRSDNILLFDLEDFKEWSEEKIYKKRQKCPYSYEF